MGAEKHILSRPRARLSIIAGLGFAVLGVLLASLLCDSSSPTLSLVETTTPVPTTAPTPELTPSPPPPTVAASPINGVLVEVGELARLQQRPPLAVMIENHPDARPQSGLNQADLVYEAIAEGGITRFMPVYWRSDAERIAFVRSARIYYIHWAAELGAVYVHWGQVEDPGRVDVWPVLARLNMRVLNGIFLGEQVGYRDPSRYAPHNVYTSTGLLWSTAESHGFAGPPALEPWSFKEDAQRSATPGFRSAPAIDVTFGNAGSSYAVRWEYDPASNAYLRTMGGMPHTDGTTGERLSARNVAVQFATLRPSGVKAYNIIDTVGTGAAVVFQDGIAIEGTWRKDSEAGRTRFYDAAGNEIAFNRGRTWIEVVPGDSAVGY